MRNIRKKKSEDERQDEKHYNTQRRYLLRSLKKTGVQKFSEHMDVHQYNLEYFEKSINFFVCTNCKKKHIVSLQDKNPCATKGKSKSSCYLFTKKNNMDPQDVPEVLKDLTLIEKQLIARVHPVVSLYKIKNCQYKYKGNIINFPQEVQEVANILPHTINKLDNIITIRLDNSQGSKDFLVRRSVVKSALIWLKQNNPLYKDIHISEKNCEALPLNGSVYQEIRGYNKNQENTQTDSSSEEDEKLQHSNEYEDDTDIEEITTTCTPQTYDFTKSEHVNNEVNNSFCNWPTIGKTPINEFTTPGYITMAFPHLFPYGTGDFSMPRQTKVTIKDYIKHVILYHDGRFSKDERFRYFIMNTEMRWTSLNTGSIFVRKNEPFTKMTLLQLKEYLKDNPKAIREIMHYSSRIRSTRPYWNSRCSELLDMVTKLDAPTLFFTLSSADFHWPEPYKLLNYDPQKLTPKEKAKIISENPLVFDTYFFMKSKYFMDNCFSKFFGVKDLWYRYEYQHRGSIHLHGIAWFKDAPKINGNLTSSKQIEIINYFDNLISCENPDPNVHIDDIHPCQLKLSSVTSLSKDLAQLVNRVQRHTSCKKQYCLRKKNKKVSCRFKFPFELQEKSSLIIEDCKIKEFVFKRNDHLLNKYNPWVLQTWRANIDFTPIVSDVTIYKYIAKYASKCESKSLDFSTVIKTITNGHCNENEHCKKGIRKLLISSLSERDYSAQEVMHYLMGHPYYHSSRSFVIVNLRNMFWENIGKTKRYKSTIQKYIDRPSYLQCYCLYDFAKNYDVRSNSYIRRKKNAIVRFFPMLKVCEDGSFDESCFDVMYTLFIPWIDVSDFKKTTTEKLEKLMLMTRYIREQTKEGKIINCYKSSNSSDEEDDSFQENKADTLSAYHPLSIKKETKIGKRDIDINFTWDDSSKNVDMEDLNEIYNRIIGIQAEQQKFQLGQYTLDNQQKNIIQQLQLQTRQIMSNKNITNRVTVVQGNAGCGKSFMLKVMYNYIVDKFGFKSIKVLGPTGVSSKNVNGPTIQSYLKIGRMIRNINPLVGEELFNFQKGKEDLKFLFIDEYSFVGLRLFATIEHRLREMMDSRNTFGNLIIYLFGDCNQLIPIGDIPLFRRLQQNTSDCHLLEKGQLLLHEISKCFFLSQSKRSKDKKYINFLNRLANGKCTEEDQKEVKGRCFSLLPRSEQKLFSEAIKIAGTNEIVDDYNISKLVQLNKPVAEIRAKNSNSIAKNSTDDDADGLQNILYLSIGAKIMLRRNLIVSRGLVNGAIGKIYKILYQQGEKPPKLPKFILVEFEDIRLEDLNVRYVPLKPILVGWKKNGHRCTRLQYPIHLCWACTIHKSQSLGFIRMILETGDTQFAMGLLYVAFSRVPNFNSMCTVFNLSLDRLNSVRRSKLFNDRSLFIKWLEKLQ